MRTTVDIDTPILTELKKIQKKEGKTLGRLMSELLARALADRRAGRVSERPAFGWNTARMSARVDLEDKEAVRALLDRDRR